MFAFKGYDTKFCVSRLDVVDGLVLSKIRCREGLHTVVRWKDWKQISVTFLDYRIHLIYLPEFSGIYRIPK